MRFYKTLNKFKASNVELDINDLTATSYGWWLFVKRINGLVVFNSYNYSSSTGQHQRKIKGVLRQLGIDVDIDIRAPKGLQNLHSALTYYEGEISTLTDLINKKGTKKAKNAERQAEVEHIRGKIAAVNALIRAENPTACQLEMSYKEQ